MVQKFASQTPEVIHLDDNTFTSATSEDDDWIKKILEDQNQIETDRFLHDVVNITYAINWYHSKLNEKTHLDEEAKTCLQKASKWNLYLQQLLEHHFALAKQNRLLIEEPFSFTATLNEVNDLIIGQLEEKNIKLKVLNLKNIPFEMIGDSTYLKQILINLLTNAIKYSDTNTTIKLDFSYSVSKESLTCRIQDQGRGIAREDLTRLFQDYSQVGDPEAHKQGMGLGLAHVQAMVEKMVSVHPMVST